MYDAGNPLLGPASGAEAEVLPMDGPGTACGILRWDDSGKVDVGVAGCLAEWEESRAAIGRESAGRGNVRPCHLSGNIHLRGKPVRSTLPQLQPSATEDGGPKAVQNKSVLVILHLRTNIMPISNSTLSCASVAGLFWGPLMMGGWQSAGPQQAELFACESL